MPEERKESHYVPVQTGVDTLAEADRAETGDEDHDGHDVHVRKRSKQLSESFRPIKYFLQIFCNFPFEAGLRINGTVFYTSKVWALSFITVIYLFVTVVATILFVGLTVGFICVALDAPESISSKEKNLCSQPWEKNLLYQCMAPLVVTYDSIALLFLGRIYYYPYGKDFEYYYNYWNRAVQIMDMDVTWHVGRNAIFGNLAFCVIVVTYVGFFATGQILMMQDTCASLVNAFVRFVDRDMYKGPGEAMTVLEYEARKDGHYANDPSIFDKQANSYKVAKWIGLLIMFIGMYGVRSFIVQFSFFCRVLRNGAYIWNERLRNYFLKEKADPEDQTKYRLGANYIVQDHLIIVHLYKMTEANFCVVLQCFYFFQLINVIAIVYGFYLLANVTNCSEFFDLVNRFVLYSRNADGKCKDDTIEEYNNGTKLTRYSFDDPKEPRLPVTFQEALVLILLLLTCFVSLFQTTVVGAKAYEEGMRGWHILRRNAFMNAKNGQEKNFVHTLNISFARNNPLEISAGGYFAVNKELLVVVLITVLVYFTTLIQFQPGLIKISLSCIAVNSTNTTITVNVHDESLILE